MPTATDLFSVLYLCSVSIIIRISIITEQLQQQHMAQSKPWHKMDIKSKYDIVGNFSLQLLKTHSICIMT